MNARQPDEPIPFLTKEERDALVLEFQRLAARLAQARLIAPATSTRLMRTIHRERRLADERQGHLADLVAKAMNLGTRAGFDRAVALLAAQLRRATGRADVDAVREAVAVLDVDWVRTTAAERRRLVAEAMAAALRAMTTYAGHAAGAAVRTIRGGSVSKSSSSGERSRST